MIWGRNRGKQSGKTTSVRWVRSIKWGNIDYIFDKIK